MLTVNFVGLDPVRKLGVHATLERVSAGRQRRNRPSVNGK